MLSVCDCPGLREHRTTPRHPAASRGGECVGASTAALSIRLGFVGSCFGMAPQGRKVCLEPLQKAGSSSQIHGMTAMQGLLERSWWAGGSVALLGKCWVIKCWVIQLTLKFAKGLCEVSDAHWVSLPAHSQYLARNFVLILCKCKVPFVKSNSRVWIWHSCTCPR